MRTTLKTSLWLATATLLAALAPPGSAQTFGTQDLGNQEHLHLAGVKIEPAAVGADPPVEEDELPAAEGADPFPDPPVVEGGLPFEFTPGSEVVLVVEMWLDPDWHVYGALEETGDPPEIVIDGGGPVTPMGTTEVPPGELHHGAGSESYWVLGGFDLRQRVKIAEGLEPGVHTLSGTVEYVTCNKTSCLPPAEIPFTADLIVVEGAPVIAAADEELIEDDPYEYDDLYFEDEHKLAVVDTTLRPDDLLGPGDVAWLDIRLHSLAGWHVYGGKEEVGAPPELILDEGSPVELVGDLVVPDGEAHSSAAGDSYWLENGFRLRQKVRVREGARDNVYTIVGKIEYVSCRETQCLMPKQLEFDAMLMIEAAAAGSGLKGEGGPSRGAAEPGAVPPPEPASPEPEDESFQLGAFLLLAVGAGLFALVMPCTYPMIPITISFFTKQAADKSVNTTLLSLIYGGGIITSFVLIGIIVGEPIIAFAQSPYLNLFIGVMFVVFALSLFGLFTIGPPRFLMDLAAKASTMATGSGAASAEGAGGGVFKGTVASLAGVFGMGLTLVITSFTCSAPFIGMLLALGAKQGGAGKVALGMAVFGLTMAIPFMVLSLLPGRAAKMPRAGEWMNTAKVFFGFVELAAALKFFSNAEYAWGFLILPKWLFFISWALLFAAAAAYLFGFFRKHATVGSMQRLAAAATMVFAAYCGWGAAGGKVDRVVMVPLAPPYLEFFKTNLGLDVIENDLYRALEVAESDGKLLLINFTGYT